MMVLQLTRWLVTLLPARGLWRDTRGVTAVEYVIIAIIITTAMIGGLGFIGGQLSTDFNNVNAGF